MEIKKEIIKSIRDKTNMDVGNIRNAMKVCDDENMTIEYLKLKYIAVAHYKNVNGKRVKWEEQDYIEHARANVQNKR